MCDECAEFDKTIAKYRRINREAFDPLTTERIERAITEMEARKVALH